MERLNRLALYILMLLYVPLVLGLAAGLLFGAGYATWWLLTSDLYVGLRARAAIFLLALDVAVLFSALVLVLGMLPLFFREVDDSTPGIPLWPKSHPNLFALIERLSRRMGTRPPEAVFLNPFDDAWIADRSISEDGRVRHNVRTLVVGAVHVIQSDVGQFATLLGHEMAHAAGGDTRMGTLASRFFRSMASSIVAHEDTEDAGWINFFVRLGLVGYYRLFAILYLYDSRCRELRADRMAAEVFGPDHARKLLLNTHVLGHLEQLSIHGIVGDFVQREKPLRNVYAEYLRRRAELPAAVVEQAENEMFMEPGSIWSTHPPLAERFRGVSRVQAREWAATQPATALFKNWLGLEEKMTRLLVEHASRRYKAYLRELDWQLRSL